MAFDPLDVTVVVIARNEERNIAACLRSLAALDYPKDSYEVLLVDNASTDRTRELAEALIEKEPNMRLAVNETRGIAPSRNFGLSQARRPHVAFIDADCTAEPGWLKALSDALREEYARDSSVVAVGGPNIAPDDAGLFRQAVAVAVSTYWGSHGSVQGQGPSARVAVEHLPTLNVLYHRERVLAAGSFDVGQGNISEDVELSHRLRWLGLKLIYDPRAVVRHRWREDLWSWARNMEVYGKGRSWLMKKDSRFIRALYLAPAALLLAAAASPLAFPFPLYLAPALHLTLTLTIAFYACMRARRPALFPLVTLIFLTTHYAYGLGQFHGALVRRGSD